jgi:hypothetical protein
LKESVVVAQQFLPQKNLSFIAAKTTAWFVHTLCAMALTKSQNMEDEFQ